MDQETRKHNQLGDAFLSGEFLSRDDVARLLNVSPRTIARWENLRQGPPRIKIGNRIFYRRVSLAAWLQSHEVDPVRHGDDP